MVNNVADNQTQFSTSNVSVMSETISAATITYDFNSISNGSGLVAFDASTFNKLDDNTTDYIKEIENLNTYFGDSSQATATGIKFGKSKEAGKLTLTFKSEIKSVKLYANMYKNYGSNIVVNGQKTDLTKSQDEESDLITFTPSEKTKVLTIETSGEKGSDGFYQNRAWLKKLIVDVDSGTVEEEVVKSIRCVRSYSLRINRTLRLQAFDDTKVVNGVEWSIISGEEHAVLVNGRLTGKSNGTVVVQGTYGSFDPIYMTVNIGASSAETTFKSIKDLRECFEATSTKIDLTAKYKNLEFATYGKVVGFDTTSSKNFYINDGSSTIYVYNSKYDQSQIKIGTSVYLTGTLSAYNSNIQLNLTSFRRSLDKIEAGNYFKDTISTYAQFTSISDTFANKLVNLHNFYNVEARFGSYSKNSASIFFTDNPTKLITLYNADSFETSIPFDQMQNGCDIAFNGVFTTYKENGQFAYVTGSKLTESVHEFTGSVSDIALSKTTENLAVGKSLDVSTLVTVNGSGDYNKNVVYSVDDAAKGTVDEQGKLTIANDVSLVGKTITVTVASAVDSNIKAIITITITEILKSSTITSKILGMSSPYGDDATGKSIATTDDTSTITVAYLHCADYGDGIQMRKNSKTPFQQSSIYSLGTATYNISSITINQNASKGAKASNLFEVFGSNTPFTASLSAAAEGVSIITTASNGLTLEYNFGTNNFKYFKVQRTTTTGTVYCDSIVVSYKK